MPLPMPPPIQQPAHHHHRGVADIYRPRRGSTGHGSTSSLSDDDADAITPCASPALELTNTISQHKHQHQPQQSQNQHNEPHSCRTQNGTVQRSNSWRNSSTHEEQHFEDHESETVDAETLWRRMLAIQRAFGCYNSARMRAALEVGGDSSGFTPSRTCLDLLNDSIDQLLPEESKRQVEEFLEHGEGTIGSSRASKRRSWRQRLLHPVSPAL
ncbi:hypothetical protein B0H66DRAFT_568568 [Apodospora peruviana]|uniref:Uncharacterized protein n=1 Tax=Apodospora peruviana TaxID=516989 RepID=A0AAE0HTL7_9PEZI|nr:hypothetical protein B0H66DRAFT_568568 [Apodospora peruviana]